MNQCIKCKEKIDIPLLDGKYCSFHCRNPNMGKRATYESSHSEHKMWRIYWDAVFTGLRYPHNSEEEAMYNMARYKLYTQRYARKIQK